MKKKMTRAALAAQIASIVGIIAIVAMIGFGLSACGGDDDGGGTHTHTYSTTWSGSVTQHWKECTDASCDATTETANHAPADGVCTTCGYDNTPMFPMQMVDIPSGTLTWPNATITLSAFKMGKYEVTQEQYEAVIGINPSDFSSNPAAGETQGKRPVERVNWERALVFCNKLSILEGLTPAYSINESTNPDEWGTPNWNAVTVVSGSTGYRLPTEAQWEYACRAGSTTDWYFGDDESELVNYAWYDANSNSRTHQVGLKLPNAFGLYDMHGNVMEWCWDGYGSLPTSNQTDYAAVSGSDRVVRGGNWAYSAEEARSSYRDGFFRNIPLENMGFRVVRP